MDCIEHFKAYTQFHDEIKGAISGTKNCYLPVWRLRQNILSQLSLVPPPARKTWPAIQILQSLMARYLCCLLLSQLYYYSPRFFADCKLLSDTSHHRILENAAEFSEWVACWNAWICIRLYTERQPSVWVTKFKQITNKPITANLPLKPARFSPKVTRFSPKLTRFSPKPARFFPKSARFSPRVTRFSRNPQDFSRNPQDFPRKWQDFPSNPQDFPPELTT